MAEGYPASQLLVIVSGFRRGDAGDHGAFRRPSETGGGLPGRVDGVLLDAFEGVFQFAANVNYIVTPSFLAHGVAPCKAPFTASMFLTPCVLSQSSKACRPLVP